MKSKEEQIELNLEGIDFQLIQKTMKSNGWTWKDPKTEERRTPSVLEISKAAKFCMEQAFDAEDGICRYGRFEAEIVEGVVIIKYVLTQSAPLIELLD